jgi:hypothetical protein
MMERLPWTRFLQGCFRLSSCSSGEDEGEGFERSRFQSVLTLPLLFGQGEAIRSLRVAQIFSGQT